MDAREAEDRQGELLAAVRAILSSSERKREHLALTYRCPSGCTLVRILTTPLGTLAVIPSHREHGENSKFSTSPETVWPLAQETEFLFWSSCRHGARTPILSSWVFEDMATGDRGRSVIPSRDASIKVTGWSID